MFGISGEHILVLGIVLLIFGPRRLPEVGNTLGKAIRNFKDALSGVEEASFRRIDETSQPKPAPGATAQAAAEPAPHAAGEAKSSADLAVAAAEAAKPTDSTGSGTQGNS